MTNNELLKSYQSMTHDDELIASVSELFLHTKKENDYDIFIETAIFLTDLYFENNNFDNIHLLFNDVIGLKDEMSQAQILKALYKYLQCLLKLEEYEKILNILDTHYQYFYTNENNDIMHYHFYKSLAYEGIFNIESAISELEQIKDNISKGNMINKYLKLGLLYIKNNNLGKANEAYNYSLMLDPSKKNEMFLLVKSDLLFSEGKFEEALREFESFFIKASNKYKYLDRYILINLKLKRYDDAYRFYNQYISKQELHLSRNNLYSFYKAGYILFTELNLKDEMKDVLHELNKYKPVKEKVNIENLEDRIIYKLIKTRSEPIKFTKIRDIIYYYFKLISLEMSLNRLAYFSVFEETKIYTYSKGLLLEKNLTSEEINNSVLFEIINSELTVYKKKDFIDYKTLKNEDSFIESHKIFDEASTFGYIIIFLDKSIEAYTKIFTILENVILYKIYEYLRVIDQNFTIESLKKLFAKHNYGVFSLINNNVKFIDNESQKLLNMNNVLMPFTIFSTYFKEEVFEDDFSLKSEMTLTLNSNESIRFKNICIDNDIWSIFFNVTEDTIKEKNFLDYFYYQNGFKNLNKFNEEIVDFYEKNYAILGVKLDFDYLLQSFIKDNIYTKIYNILSNKHSNFYYLNDGCFIMLLDTVDKRNIINIYNNLCDELYEINLKNISGFAFKNLKGKKAGEIIKMISFSLKKREHGLSFFDNENKITEAKLESFTEYAKNIINNKVKVSTLKEIVDYSTHKVKFHYLEIFSGELYSKIDLIDMLVNNNLYEKLFNIYLQEITNIEEKQLPLIIECDELAVLNKNLRKKLLNFNKKIKRCIIINMLHNAWIPSEIKEELKKFNIYIAYNNFMEGPLIKDIKDTCYYLFDIQKIKDQGLVLRYLKDLKDKVFVFVNSRRNEEIESLKNSGLYFIESA